MLAGKTNHIAVLVCKRMVYNRRRSLACYVMTKPCSRLQIGRLECSHRIDTVSPNSEPAHEAGLYSGGRNMDSPPMERRRCDHPQLGVRGYAELAAERGARHALADDGLTAGAAHDIRELADCSMPSTSPKRPLA